MYSNEHKKVIMVSKAEPRTSKAGKPYTLITDSENNIYGKWEESVVNPEMMTNKQYTIIYEISGDKNQYKNIKVNGEVKDDL